MYVICIKGKSLSERIGFSVVIQIVKRVLVLVLKISSTKIAPIFLLAPKRKITNCCSEV